MRLPSPKALLRGRSPLDVLPQPGPEHLPSTWRLAVPSRIANALQRASERDPGGWCVAGATADLSPHTSIVSRVAGREVVLWRDRDGALQAGPGSCPHLGALLDNCPVVDGTVRCRWHGMALGPRGETRWAGYSALDDGVLLWVQLPLPGEDPGERPRLPVRPPLQASIAAVVEREGVCEPRDIIANRLDPWHGAWFHPYAFSHLTVDEAASDEDSLAVDVAYRLGRRIGVSVQAEFTCPDARTIVMTIVEGEGSGSVVETHATPLGSGPDGLPRTKVTEATIAHSDRPGFRMARLFAPAVRAGLRKSAERLWIDDLAYAERIFEVRQRSGTVSRREPSR